MNFHIYNLLIQCHVDGSDLNATFMFKNKPSDKELKEKIGNYFYNHQDEFIEMISPHFVVNKYAPIEFKKFKKLYKQTLNELKMPYKCNFLIDEDNNKILKCMFEKLKTEPALLYDFCLINWINFECGDYSYQPKLCYAERLIEND